MLFEHIHIVENAISQNKVENQNADINKKIIIISYALSYLFLLNIFIDRSYLNKHSNIKWKQKFAGETEKMQSCHYRNACVAHTIFLWFNASDCK